MSSLRTPLERAFTMDEAANELRISRRALQELIKRHPFYYQNGCRKLFEETDIANLRLAMRGEAQTDRQRIEECRSSSYRRVDRRRRTSRSEAHTSGSIWTEAQSRLAELRRQSS